MSDVSTWNPLDSANTVAPPDGWPEFMMPSMVNNTGRMMMGAVRRMYDTLNDGTLVLPYLKLSGGTVSGSTTISALLTANSIVSNSTIHANGAITAGGSISASGSVNAASGFATASGNITTGASGTVSTSEYKLNGVTFAKQLFDIGTNALYDATGQWCLALRSTTSGENYYANNTHRFVTRNNAAALAILDASGLAVTGAISATGGLTVIGAATVGSITATGSIQSNRADAQAFYAPNGGITCALDISGRNFNASGNVNITGGSVNISGSGGAGGGDLTVAMVLYAHDVMPSADNVSICGGAASAWNVVEAYNFITKSDVALKQDIGPLPDTLPLVTALAPKAFQYDGADDRRHWGFVAQDVRDAVSSYPVDLVTGDEGRLGLDYGGLTAMLWKAVQELAARLTALEGGE